jgi:hypothetical protein
LHKIHHLPGRSFLNLGGDDKALDETEEFCGLLVVGELVDELVMGV